MGVAIFIASAALILYILFGYPALLAILSRRERRPVRKAPLEATVTVILPVHNGERWIRAKLDSIYALGYPRRLMDLIVASDGSTDATEDIVRRYGGSGLQLLSLPRGGKAAAINAALSHARGDILFFTDVRQALSHDSLENLLACFADPQVGVVSGELVIREGDTTEEASVGMYWKYEKWIRMRLSRIDSILGATGCIYAMRRELAVPLPSGSLLDDMYQPLAAFFRGYRVILEPSAKAYDYPTSLDSEFRRKVRTLAGNYQILRAYPALLGPGNRMWIHFLSHKLGRLLLPLLLITVAVSSATLPSPWSWIALAVQAAFYLTGLVDVLLPDRSPLKRLTSPVRTFIVLMAAAFCALSIMFVPGSSLWRTTEVRRTESAGV